MSFPILPAVISMVLGLSVTQLLTGLVTLLRIRRKSPIDRMPLAWSGILFAMQLEYWWAINQLPTLRQAFQFSEFFFLVFMTPALFVTSALLLPSRGEDETHRLPSYFQEDGRYALLSIPAFSLIRIYSECLWVPGCNRLRLGSHRYSDDHSPFARVRVM